MGVLLSTVDELFGVDIVLLELTLVLVEKLEDGIGVVPILLDSVEVIVTIVDLVAVFVVAVIE